VVSRKWFRSRNIWIAVAIVILLSMGIGYVASREASAPERLAFSDLLRDIDRGAVTAVVISGDALEVRMTDGRTVASTAPAGFTANPTFAPELARQGIRVEVRTAAEPAAYSFTALFLGLAFVGVLGLALYRVTSGRIPALETKTREADPESVPVTFADVAGVDEAKEEVGEIVDFLREPERFMAIGGRIPKGVLLVGPPGTGKTLLARSIAGEAKVPFLFSSGSDFVEMPPVSARRGSVSRSRMHAAILPHRSSTSSTPSAAAGGNSLSHEERVQTLDQLLVEMDGLRPIRHRGDRRDQPARHPRSALLRPGRFDSQ
jgi:cell division protease FtsH